MNKNLYIPLNHRSLIAIYGNDSKNFLQGIITNDINLTDNKTPIYSLMLTPQGKFLYDFFIIKHEDKFYIDCFKESLATIIKKLKMYKLKSDVIIEDLSEKYEVISLIGDNISETINNENHIYPFCKGVVYKDTRSENLYARAFIEKENNYQSFHATGFEIGDIQNYKELRINAKVPEGHIDLISENSFPHDFEMKEFNAISYNKGCYIGQEVTARVEYKGKKRKKLCKISFDASQSIKFGDIIYKNDKKAGVIYSTIGNLGLAIIENDVLECKNHFQSNGTNIKVI